MERRFSDAKSPGSEASIAARSGRETDTFQQAEAAGRVTTFRGKRVLRKPGRHAMLKSTRPTPFEEMP
jgi:hypothetical protein